MSEYVPMVGPHPGVRYMPSNGTEGACFLEAWCGTQVAARGLVLHARRDYLAHLQDHRLTAALSERMIQATRAIRRTRASG